jgi:hypothetical protein
MTPQGRRPDGGARDGASYEHVKLSETLIRVRDRQPHHYEKIEAELLNSGIRFVPPGSEAAVPAEPR